MPSLVLPQVPQFVLCRWANGQVSTSTVVDGALEALVTPSLPKVYIVPDCNLSLILCSIKYRGTQMDMSWIYFVHSTWVLTAKLGRQGNQIMCAKILGISLIQVFRIGCSTVLSTRQTSPILEADVNVIPPMLMNAATREITSVHTVYRPHALPM